MERMGGEGRGRIRNGGGGKERKWAKGRRGEGRVATF